MRIPTFLLLLALLVPCRPALAQPDRGIVTLPRLAGPVTLDGRSDEAAWQAVAPLPLAVHQPVFGAPATEETEILAAYDDDHLYVAGRLYDADPSGIRANSLYRDRYSGDDLLAVVIDAFDDNENARWFYTSPAGVRFDAAVSNDALNGTYNQDWNTHWDVATTRTDDGWFAEMRIPFSSLGFQNTGGRVVMGLIAYRYIARKNERHIYPAIRPDWNMAYLKPSQAQDVALEGVYSQTPLYVTPYLLGGTGTTARLNAPGTGFDRRTDLTREVGLDAKYNLTSNLTLDLTVNTDFAQVEADDQQVNLTRFSLFFPEKRQFFQERAGIFDFNTTGSDRLFHSRRIGLDAGLPVRLLGGARLVGRVGAWDVGLLDMQTGDSRGLPSENFGVARLRRQVFNPNSYAGGMVTSRVGADGAYNVAYGLDAHVRVTGDEYLTAKWAQTVETDGPTDPREAGHGYVRWERRRNQGWHYAAEAGWAGPAYHPALGFATRRDFTRLGGYVMHDRFLGEGSPLRRAQPGFWGNTYLRNEDGSVESGMVQHFTSLEFKNGSWFFIGPTVRYEDVRTPFSLSPDAGVPAGSYTFYDVWTGYWMGSTSLVTGNVDLRGGTFYDGWWLWHRIVPTWRLSQHLELSGEYQLNLIRFPDRGEAFDAHLGRLRVQAALNTRLSVNAFLQYSSAADAASLNGRLRYHFGEGHDLWLVYDEGLNMERHQPGLPTLPLSDRRVLMLKYTHTLVW